MGAQSGKCCASDTSALEDGSEGKFDFFLSHKQSEAQDAVATMIFDLTQARPSIKVWLDLEQNLEQELRAEGMEEGVRDSKVFLFYCTKDIAFSKYCLMELGWAIKYQKKIVLVAETDPRHGAIEISTLRDRMPEDMQRVFEENVAIPWYRDPAHRAVSVQRIIDILGGKEDAEGHRTVKDGTQMLKQEPVLIAAVSSSFQDTTHAVNNDFWTRAQP
mmetsp:Transcript_9470/g.15038  ORF Transcript_9470/g.15038 Transcript_9470/m.15038 type:complete len:217 (-) Transcript_9470:83-733(-)